MKKFWIVIIVLAVLLGLELFYFQFHTYFQKTEINEALPQMMASTEAKTLASGSFTEIDIVHKGSGTAKLVEVDGKTILRFEDFDVTSGPDLYVYLSSADKPEHGANSLKEYADLGVLKATSGNQNYEVPAEAAHLRTAVIWCKKFGVLFSFAVMR